MQIGVNPLYRNFTLHFILHCVEDSIPNCFAGVGVGEVVEIAIASDQELGTGTMFLSFR